jgi:hypothetical protein
VLQQELVKEWLAKQGVVEVSQLVQHCGKPFESGNLIITKGQPRFGPTILIEQLEVVIREIE